MCNSWLFPTVEAWFSFNFYRIRFNYALWSGTIAVDTPNSELSGLKSRSRYIIFKLNLLVCFQPELQQRYFAPLKKVELATFKALAWRFSGTWGGLCICSFEIAFSKVRLPRQFNRNSQIRSFRQEQTRCDLNFRNSTVDNNRETFAICC